MTPPRRIAHRLHPLSIQARALSTALSLIFAVALRADDYEHLDSWFDETTGEWSGSDGGGTVQDDPPESAGYYCQFEDFVWNQWQPFNDFAPVVDPVPALENDGGYRGRAPAGCVAVSAAELFAHHAWPRRAGPGRTSTHKIIDSSGALAGRVSLRFDGSVPFEWDSLFKTEPFNDIWNGERWFSQDDPDYDDIVQNDYWKWDESVGDWVRGFFYYDELQSSQDSTNDLRGVVAESFRFPPARLCLWTMSLSETEFGPYGSGGSYEDVALNAREWYEPGRWAKFDADGSLHADDSAALEALMVARIPVPVKLSGVSPNDPEHLALVCGWDSTGAKTKLYLNFGWSSFSFGDPDNGWYAPDETVAPTNTENKYVFNSVLLGHLPRARPQLEPMRAVIDGTETLEWAFPRTHSSALQNWIAERLVFAERPVTRTERFDDDSATRFVGAGASVCDSDAFLPAELVGGNALRFESSSNVVCELPWIAVLSGQSELSMRTRFYWASGNRLSVEARFGDGPWESLAEPGFDGESDSGWRTLSIPLGEHSGESVQFRFVNQYVENSSYYQDVGIWIDDLSLSDAYFPNENESVTMPVTAAGDRSLPVSAFGTPPAGRRVAFTVTPVFKQGARSLASPETSRPAVVRVCDATTPALPMPAVTSVSTVVGTPLQEEFFRECARGSNAIFVNCTDTVVSLEARSGNLSALPDSAVAVTPLGSGQFAVELDGSGIPTSADRTRLLLTLVATDANGSRAAKDLVLRFSGESAADHNWDVDFQPESADSLTGAAGATIAVPRVWIVENGLAAPDATDETFAAAVAADADGDRVPNAVEWVCGTNPLDATEAFHAEIELVGGEPRVSVSAPALRPGYETVLQGRPSLDADSRWEDADTDRHHFFRALIRTNGN